MKKQLLLIIIFITTLFTAQTQDLYTLAKGDYLGFNALFDQKDNLYGYIAIYGYGKSGDKTKKFEYVILDKNLNPVANKEFEGDITAGDYFGYIDFRGQIILKPSSMDYSLVKSRDIFTPSSMVIDPKNNTITKKVYYDYDHGTFKELNEPKNWKEERKETREEKKQKGYNYISYVAEIKEGGYLAVEYDDYGKYVNNNSLIKFDDNKKEIWRYKYNTNGDKNYKTELSIIEKDNDHIYIFLKKIQKNETYFDLLVLDMKTGSEVINRRISDFSISTLSNIDSFYSNYKRIDNDKTFDDKIVMVGRNYPSDETTGFARMIINKKDFTINASFLNYLPDFEKYVPKIKSDGGVENGYFLLTRDMYFLKDGSIGLLMEKYKPGGQYTAPKTTDLVYAYTDKDFKIKDIKVFNKEITRWTTSSDYLFSQYLNDGKDVVFFYRDYKKDEVTKEKKWNLFINTIIDGNFKQETISISEKDNYLVTPYVGKEGYILLQEYNKKEKYNKIRLERLNY